MPVTKLREFLDSETVKYTVTSHSLAYTAQEIAACAHVPGQELAKTVMIKVNGKMAMAVLPAPKQIHFDHLKTALGAQTVDMATEDEFKKLFPDCEVGAMPPFGNLYGLDVYLDQALAEDEEIAFNAGSHTELVKMPYKDFERLAQPKVLDFSRH